MCGHKSRGCFWSVCRAWSRFCCSSSARPVGAPGCTDFPRCRLDSPSVLPRNTGSLSWVVRAHRESRTGPGCRWARSSPGNFGGGRPAGGSIARSWPVRAIRWRCSITSWPSLKRRPDAVIIYAGHNEFVARFEEEREGWLDEQRGIVAAPSRLSRDLEFILLLFGSTRSSARTGWTARHRLPSAISSSTRLCAVPSESAEILDDFSRRLEAIVSYCDQIGALPILIVPPANEAGYEPSRSTISPSVSADRAPPVG